MPVDINVVMYNSNKDRHPEGWNDSVSWFWNDPSIVESFIEENKEILVQYIDAIVRSGIKIAGFTIYGNSYLMSCYLASEIKKRNKNVIIVFGGPSTADSLRAKEIILNNNVVDIVVQGEGELTLLEIVKRIIEGKEVESPGTIFRRNNKVITAPVRDPIKDMDSLPFPDFSDFDFFQYKEPFQCPIESSRGCVNKCVFCNERTFWNRYRSRSGASMYNEMRYQLERYPHIAYFEFHDNLVNGNIRELERMCDCIIEGKRQIFWGGSAIVRKEMTYDLFLKLRKAGCTSLSFGIESTSKSVLEKVGKIFAKAADIDSIVRSSYKAGVSCCLNFMFGLPGETDDEAEENIEFIRRHAKYIKAVNPSPALCFIGPGTSAYESPEKYGIDLTKGGTYWDSTDGENTFLRRLKRFEKFISEAHRLKIHSIYPHPKLVNRNEVIADYYFYTKEYEKAIPYYKNALEKESCDKIKEEKLNTCFNNVGTKSIRDKL
ncbi:MAG: B12-binding domain-containing radical SAM protein [Spirochaetales bacterium]|nr:B12-binding domain-containing radical SAM protein [Spirochaetales bacterium]